MRKLFKVPFIAAGLTIAFIFLVFGYYLGKNYRQDSYYVTLEKEAPPVALPIKSNTDLTENGKININSAAAEELCKLKGIGPVLAERIISYREEYGGFDYSFELMNVSGIGKAVYENIKDEITVG